MTLTITIHLLLSFKSDSNDFDHSETSAWVIFVGPCSFMIVTPNDESVFRLRKAWSFLFMFLAL